MFTLNILKTVAGGILTGLIKSDDSSLIVQHQHQSAGGIEHGADEIAFPAKLIFHFAALIYIENAASHCTIQRWLG